MTETDISKVLIEGDYATIMGVKYKRVEELKSPAEEAYQEIYGNYPMGEPFWIVFKKGYEAAEKSKVEPSFINCVLEGNPPNGYSYWNEWFRELGSKGILHNLKISSKEFNEKVKEPTKPMDEVVDRLIKQHQAQKLWNRLFEVGYDGEDCDMILSIVEDWLPKEQSAAGSQNVYVECSVEGFNDCLTEIKGKLR
jgi:hypothetical protein